VDFSISLSLADSRSRRAAKARRWNEWDFLTLKDVECKCCHWKSSKVRTTVKAWPNGNARTSSCLASPASLSSFPCLFPDTHFFSSHYPWQLEDFSLLYPTTYASSNKMSRRYDSRVFTILYLFTHSVGFLLTRATFG
jgi:hypothetical protein